MTPLDAVFAIVQLGITILAEEARGNPTNLEQSLLDMAKKGVAAYEAQSGKPIDPALLHEIEPVA